MQSTAEGALRCRLFVERPRSITGLDMRLDPRLNVKPESLPSAARGRRKEMHLGNCPMRSSGAIRTGHRWTNRRSAPSPFAVTVGT
jgi:hypothetical protein